MSTAVLFPTNATPPTFDSIVEPQCQSQQHLQKQRKQDVGNGDQPLTTDRGEDNDNDNDNDGSISSSSSSAAAAAAAMTTSVAKATNDANSNDTAITSMTTTSEAEAAAEMGTKTKEELAAITASTVSTSMSHNGNGSNNAANENSGNNSTSTDLTDNNGSTCSKECSRNNTCSTPPCTNGNNSNNSNNGNSVTNNNNTTTMISNTGSSSSSALVLYNPIPNPVINAATTTSTISNATTATNATATASPSLPSSPLSSAVVTTNSTSTSGPSSSSTTTAITSTTSTNATVTAATATTITVTNHKYKGLPNLGNTCYLNSAIQMLYSIDSFVSLLIEHYSTVEDKDDGNYDNMKDCSGDGIEVTNIQNGHENEHDNDNGNGSDKNDKEELVDSFPLHCALANLFASMRSTTTTTTTTNAVTTTATTTPSPSLWSSILNTNNNSINPSSSSSSSITASIQQLKTVIDKQTPQFIGYQQQDSHEFLSTLIDLLHDEIVNYHKKKKEEEEKEVEEATKKTKNTNVNMVEEEKDEMMIDGDDKDGDDDEVIVYGKDGGNKMDVDDDIEMATDYSVVTEQKKEDAFVEDGYVIVNSQSQQIQQSNKKARITTNEGVNVAAAAGGDRDGKDRQKVGDDAQLNNNDKDDDEVANLTKVPSFSQLKLEEIGVLLHGSKTEPLQEKENEVQQNHQSHADIDNNIPCNVKKLVGGRISYDGMKQSSSPSSPLIELKIANESMFMEDLILEPQQQGETKSFDDSMCVKKDDDDDNDNECSSEPKNQNQAQSNDNSNTTACENVSVVSSDESPSFCTPVDTFFTMEVRTCLTCDSCNWSRSHRETFRHLSIEVGDADDEPPSSSLSSTLFKKDSVSITSTISSLHQSHYDRTVQEGLRKFFSHEKLELKCEKCFGESATQSMEIVRLPKVLLLHLKRFIVDISPDYTRISYRKNRSAVEFDEYLSLENDDPLGEFLAADVHIPRFGRGEKDGATLNGGGGDSDTNNDDDFEILEPTDVNSEEDDEDDGGMDREGFVDLGRMKRKFKIRSVINHIGSSASCGHYTANAFKVRDNEVGGDKLREWIKFNDSYVSSLSDGEAMGEQTQKSAYLLMYELE